MNLEEFFSHLPTEVVWSQLPDGNIVTQPAGEEVCDFCMGPDPVWEYDCRDFQYGQGAASLGSWGACEVCSRLIEAGQRQALGIRAANYSYGRITGDDRKWVEVFQQMLKIHDLFRDNRYGERKPQ